MDSLHKGQFLKTLHDSGIPSVLELARRTGLHRNTINHYLAGQTVYQEGYLVMCRHMGIAAHDLVCDGLHPELPKNVAKVLDALSAKNPDLVFVLFGSRARRSAKEFSDWDIGFFSSRKIAHDQHLDLIGLADDLCEHEIFNIDLVNLNEADEEFLFRNAKDFVRLTGSLVEWHGFKEELCRISKSKRP